MVGRVFEKIGRLKDDEDNYGELKGIEEHLEGRLEEFIGEKQRGRESLELRLKWIIEDVKAVGRVKD